MAGFGSQAHETHSLIVIASKPSDDVPLASPRASRTPAATSLPIQEASLPALQQEMLDEFAEYFGTWGRVRKMCTFFRFTSASMLQSVILSGRAQLRHGAGY